MSLASLNCMAPCNAPLATEATESTSATRSRASPRAVFDSVTDPEYAANAGVYVVDDDVCGDDGIIEAVDAEVVNRFEADFNTFLNRHPSQLPSQKTIEALRVRLGKATEERVKLQRELLSGLKEEERTKNEIEVLLTKKIESVKKSNEDLMSSLHDDLIEATRSKAASEIELRGKISNVEKDRHEMEEKMKKELYLAEIELEERIRQSEKDRHDIEEKIKQERFISEQQGQLDRQPPRGALSEPVINTPTKASHESLHAEHLRISRMQRLPSHRKAEKATTAMSGDLNRSKAEGRVAGKVAYAAEPWTVGKSVADSETDPQAKELEYAGLSEEVRMLREKWEVENRANLH